MDRKPSALYARGFISLWVGACVTTRQQGLVTVIAWAGGLPGSRAVGSPSGSTESHCVREGHAGQGPASPRDSQEMSLSARWPGSSGAHQSTLTTPALCR